METSSENAKKILLPHHVQQDLCTNRPLYRQGKKLTAVKVYTINNESQHILLFQVPKINLANELKILCAQYGDLNKFELLKNHKTEIFTECYHAQFQRIQSARIAKRFLDNKSFYGDVLHVCYAPEFETVSETRAKLKQRETDVLSRLQPGPSILEYANVKPNELNPTQQNRKRKNPALPITDKRLKSEDIDLIWQGIPPELDPRIQSASKPDDNIKKHFQMVRNQPKGPEYGPNIYPDIANFKITNMEQPKQNTKNIRTTLLPTTVIKNYKNDYNKKIVFRNRKD